MSNMPGKKKDDLVQQALEESKVLSKKKHQDQTPKDTQATPFKVPLGGGRYAELTEWNGSKRVDLRVWENDTVPTKTGISLSLLLWKILCNATEVVDYLIGGVKNREPVDWRYHLGENVYVSIKAPHPTIHVRKYFVPNGEWTLFPTKKGVTLSLYEWQELKKIIPMFEEREPELRQLIPVYQTDYLINGL